MHMICVSLVRLLGQLRANTLLLGQLLNDGYKRDSNWGPQLYVGHVSLQKDLDESQYSLRRPARCLFPRRETPFETSNTKLKSSTTNLVSRSARFKND
jgi:hypothetical protein